MTQVLGVIVCCLRLLSRLILKEETVLNLKV